MPMHISPSTDTNPGRIGIMPSQMGSIMNPLSPATQNDILEILQREQDHAMALLSLSPLLSSLFVSYASRAAALESTSSTPSPESEEWKSLQATIAASLEENERHKSENLEVARKLEAAVASHEAFRSQVSSLKGVNATQQDDIQSLRAELVKARGKYDQHVVDSNTERDTLQVQVFDLEAQRKDLKEAVVEQQIKILKLERQSSSYLSDTPTTTLADTTSACKLSGPEQGRKKIGKAARRKAEREIAKKAEGEKEQIEREEGATEGAKEDAEYEVAGEREKRALVSKIPSAWGHAVGANDRPRKTSGLSQKEQRDGWTQALAFRPVEDPSGLPPSITSSVPGSPLSGTEGEDDGANSSGVCGNGFDGERNAEPIAVSILPGDRHAVFTDTARDQKREKQQENVVEEVLGSNSIKRRNNSAQSNITVKPKPAPTPAPAPGPQKSPAWGSWGSSLLTNIASTIAVPDRSPSPEPALVHPRIEDPPRGFTPSQPPKSQPAGFGSLNKPAWGAGGSGDNNAWGAVKTNPTPVTQKPSTGPVWGAKPARSTFGSGGTGWGSKTGPKFDRGGGRNPTVNPMTKPLESGPKTSGPEDIPESAVEIKHVPAPGEDG